VTLLWLLAMVFLPITAYGLAWFFRGYGFSTRDVPSDLYRMVTGTLFAGWVDPGLGVLAASGCVWWWFKGWPRISGGLLWPFVAMGVFLGLQAPQWALDAWLTALLVFGVAQTGLGIAQYFKAPVFFDGTNIHGTFGHRTGLGIYLALLIPLGFLTDYGVWLAVFYSSGVFLSRSSVATMATSAGLLWVVPSAWLWMLPAIVGALGYRMLKIGNQPGGWKFRHLGDSVFARRRIWEVTARKSVQSWRQVLHGAGHGAFQQQARTWVRSEGVQTGEVYNEAHNDYLEAFYENGLVIVLVLGWWLYRYGGALAPADPVTGSVVALGVSCLANFPTRVATLATVVLMVGVLLMRRVA